jgi:hypothetical protein
MGRLLEKLTWRPLGWALLVGVWGMSFAYARTPLNGEVLCLFRRFTGWDCPGCGLTRSFCALSAGDIVGAFDFHLAGPFLYLAMLITILLGPTRYGSTRLASIQIPKRVSFVFWWLFTLLYIGQAIRAVASWQSWGDTPLFMG